MTVYWIVWIGILMLGECCRLEDPVPDGCLTTERRRHTDLTCLFFVVASLLLIFIAGCRYYVGADFGAYYSYEGYLDFWDGLKNLEEPGIRLVYNIAVWIHKSGQFCIFCVAAVTLGLELLIIYRNTDQLEMALMLFLFMCWTACFNGVRQALAAAVLFCGYPALRDKKLIQYAVFVGLAFLCHRSAIVMILAYFIVNRPVNTRNVIILLVASFVVLESYDFVYKFVNVVMDNEITGAEGYWNSSVNILRTLSKIAPAVVFLFFTRDMEKTPQMSFYLNILLLHAVVAITTTNSACLARMSMYTAPFAVLAVAELVKIFDIRDRGLVSGAIVLLYWFMDWYEIHGSDSLNNFQLHWFG